MGSVLGGGNMMLVPWRPQTSLWGLEPGSSTWCHCLGVFVMRAGGEPSSSSGLVWGRSLLINRLIHILLALLISGCISAQSHRRSGGRTERLLLGRMMEEEDYDKQNYQGALPPRFPFLFSKLK